MTCTTTTTTTTTVVVVAIAVMCEGHREYRSCGPACRPSCRTLSGFYVDTETTHEAAFCQEAVCLEGCFCPPGTVEGRMFTRHQHHHYYHCGYQFDIHIGMFLTELILCKSVKMVTVICKPRENSHIVKRFSLK